MESVRNCSTSLMNTSSSSLGDDGARSCRAPALLGFPALLFAADSRCSSLVMPPLIRGFLRVAPCTGSSGLWSLIQLVQEASPRAGAADPGPLCVTEPPSPRKTTSDETDRAQQTPSSHLSPAAPPRCSACGRRPLPAARAACTRRAEPRGGGGSRPDSNFSQVRKRQADMVLEELAARLNDGGYKNWVKAGSCLVLLRDGLHPLVSHHTRAFHADLLNRHGPLRRPCETSCRPRDNQLSAPCRPCSEWQTVILKHHRQPRPTLNWDNCFPPHWRTDPWEVAKAYMPRGQGKVKGADQCDASALLNLMNCCGCFHFVHQKCVTEVIRYRNELMHSAELRVRDEWMSRFQAALMNLLKQFSDVPQMQKARRKIEEVLSVDLFICVSGLDEMDSARLECDSIEYWKTSGTLISQWEAELLQERLQELLHGAADDDTNTQDAEQLKRLGGFLQANRDLGERFSTELQAISSREARE